MGRVNKDMHEPCATIIETPSSYGATRLSGSTYPMTHEGAPPERILLALDRRGAQPVNYAQDRRTV